MVVLHWLIGIQIFSGNKILLSLPHDSEALHLVPSTSMTIFVLSGHLSTQSSPYLIPHARKAESFVITNIELAYS